MITIGLTTWREHPTLVGGTKVQTTLSDYAAVLPVVEVDTPFYGIRDPQMVIKWQREVPNNFQFVIKANQLMTKHDLGHDEKDDAARQAAFVAYRQMIEPLVSAHQLKAILFQFPPFFRRTTENIDWLLQIRQQLPKLPIAVEFRHPSWYADTVIESVMAYLKGLKMTHVIVDEPHRLNDGLPFVPRVTTPQLAIVRLHGRNEAGWFNQGPDWRKKRTLYRYNEAELRELAIQVRTLADNAKEVCVIFNNNSGGDAAPNALALRDLLGVTWDGLGPQQLNLF
ncbi:DUF72 domain-containing protein [uncultured Secundilactobacillus sp.]|uniref:DUF72 domain-containing protein n=1 Tax=uncultured Secundilactobacillus sp. TaxID=2813935 RepID=UPI002585CF85|nr:DUF72 domain-containing protein [uncultured Secundilactobacillus sp.]